MPKPIVIPPNLPVPGATQQPVAGAMGKEDFLKLLVGQLKNQDPLNPLKGTEFAAQLAQFSGLEQLQNMNDNLTESLGTNYILTSSINNALASNFVGKDVRASANEFHWEGGSGMRFGYYLNNDKAVKSDVKIYDQDNNLIRTLRGSLNNDENIIVWDGKDEQGGIVDEGIYRFEVDARDKDSRKVAATPFMFGKVQGVRYDSTGTVFIVDGVAVKLSEIMEVFSTGG